MTRRLLAAVAGSGGRCSQVAEVLGAEAGGAADGPALTDLVILSDQGRIFVTGPDVVRSVTGEDVDMERLGGPQPPSRRAGVGHNVASARAGAPGPARELPAPRTAPGENAPAPGGRRPARPPPPLPPPP